MVYGEIWFIYYINNIYNCIILELNVISAYDIRSSGKYFMLYSQKKKLCNEKLSFDFHKVYLGVLNSDHIEYYVYLYVTCIRWILKLALFRRGKIIKRCNFTFFNWSLDFIWIKLFWSSEKARWFDLRFIRSCV